MSMRGVVTTAAIALAVVVAYERYGGRLHLGAA